MSLKAQPVLGAIFRLIQPPRLDSLAPVDASDKQCTKWRKAFTEALSMLREVLASKSPTTSDSLLRLQRRIGEMHKTLAEGNKGDKEKLTIVAQQCLLAEETITAFLNASTATKETE